ncbi:MAG: hypothetical protein Q7K37_11940 [Dehalococcoidia bacterium]|nr:hypothetical protein [Dehalococcoidia bacterium]
MIPHDGRLGRLATWFVAVNIATVGAAMLLTRVEAGAAMRQIALWCGIGG